MHHNKHHAHDQSTVMLIEVFELLEAMLNDNKFANIFKEINKMLCSSIRFMGNSDPLNDLAKALDSNKYKHVIHEIKLINLLLKNNLSICPSRMLSLVIHANEIHMNGGEELDGGANSWNELGNSWGNSWGKVGENLGKIGETESANWKKWGETEGANWKKWGETEGTNWKKWGEQQGEKFQTPTKTNNQGSSQTSPVAMAKPSAALMILNDALDAVFMKVKTERPNALVILLKLSPQEPQVVALKQHKELERVAQALQRVVLALQVPAAMEALGKIYTSNELNNALKEVTKILRGNVKPVNDLPTPQQALEIHNAIVDATNSKVSNDDINIAIAAAIKRVAHPQPTSTTHLKITPQQQSMIRATLNNALNNALDTLYGL